VCVFTSNPTFPQYLGTYLLSYVKAKTSEASKAAAMTRYTELEAQMASEKAAAAAVQAEADAAAAALVSEEDALAAALDETTDIAAQYAAVLSLVASRTDATGVYLGRKEKNPDGISQIQYIESTDATMQGKVLKGVADGEEEGAEGVTWGLFVSSEVEEVTTDPETGEESTATKTVWPADVTVGNIVRDPAVKCFGIPKLGSYMAVPVRYSGCLQEGAMEDAPPPADPVPNEDGTMPEVDPDAPPPPKYQPVFAPAEFVVGLDTAGQGREFTNTEKEFARVWGGKLSAAAEKYERRLWEADVVGLSAWGDAADAAAAKSAAAASAAEKVAKCEGNEDAKALADVESKQVAAGEVLKSAAGEIEKVKGVNAAPKAETVKCFAAAMNLAGMEKGTFMNVLQGGVSWPLVKANMGGLVAAIEAFDATTVTAEAVEAIKGSVEGVDAAGVPFTHLVATCGVAGLALEWCLAACAHVEGYAAFKVKEAEAAEAAAAAAEAGGD